MSSKHSAPPVSPTRDQVQKKAKSGGPLFKHFIRLDEVKDMKPKHIRFKCITDFYNEKKGEPILYNKEETEATLKKLDDELNDMMEKMKDDTLDTSTLIDMGKEASEKQKDWERYKESVQGIKVSISNLKEARKNARLALVYNQKIRNFENIAEFTVLIRQADALLKYVDEADEMEEQHEQQDQQSEEIVVEEIVIEDSDGDEEDVNADEEDVNAIEEEPEEEDVDVVEQAFPSQKRYNSDRKTIAKMKDAAKKAPASPIVKLNKHGYILQGEKLPMSVRYEHRHRRGSGLFKYKDAVEFLRERITSEDEEKWWVWTPIKLQDNKQSEYGEYTCKACVSSMMHLRSITTHLKTNKHKKKVDEKKKRLENNQKPSTFLQNRIDHYITSTRNVSVDEKLHRMDAVRVAAAANIPIAAMEVIENSPYKKRHEAKAVSLGHISHLADDYIPVVFHEDLEILRIILQTQKKDDCRQKILTYEHFSIIFDGTPSFAEAEAVMVRIVMKDGRILNLLIRCALFEKKLNAENIANHIVNSVETRLGLDMTLCRAIMCDRASTNKRALRLLNERYGDIHEGKHLSFLEMWCISHTISNVGKKLYNKDVTPNIHLFRKNYQQMIQYPGQARDLAARLMKQDVKQGGGVRFFNHHEQIDQIVDYGLENLLTNFVSECVDSKWSMASATNLQKDFGTEEKRGELAMAIFEGSVISDFGRALVKACYNLEGDGELVFTAAEELDRIVAKLQQDVPMTRVEGVVDRVVQLLNEMLEAIDNDKTSATAALEAAKTNVTAKNAELTTAKHDEIIAGGGSVGADGRVRQGNPRYQNVDAMARAREQVKVAKENLKEAKESKEKCKEKLDECIQKRNAWLQKFPIRTREELMEHAASLKNPSIEYFKTQFLPEVDVDDDVDEDGGDTGNGKKPGDLVHATSILKFCNTVMNPLWIKENSHRVQFMKEQAGEILPQFGFPEFDDRFIAKFKGEIQNIVNYVRSSNFDWDGMKKSRLFKTRLEKKKRKYDDEDAVDDDWKKDVGEKATRIWEFWKSIVVNDEKYPAFSLCLKLIVLIQVSSCAVERVFSQLKCVVERVGGTTHEDALEVRMFAMCNGDLTELWMEAFEGLLEDNDYA